MPVARSNTSCWLFSYAAHQHVSDWLWHGSVSWNKRAPSQVTWGQCFVTATGKQTVDAPWLGACLDCPRRFGLGTSCRVWLASPFLLTWHHKLSAWSSGSIPKCPHPQCNGGPPSALQHPCESLYTPLPFILPSLPQPLFLLLLLFLQLWAQVWSPRGCHHLSPA